MSKLKMLGAIALGIAIYTPIGMLVFDNSIWTMLDRAYFMVAGAATALYVR